MTPVETALPENYEPEWLDKKQFSFQSRFIQINSHLVHYVDEGSGPTVLFLHGNPTWSFLYREIIKGLRDDFRCVAVDYPGFGFSQAAAGYSFTPREHSLVIEQFVKELDLTTVTLFVHDWGGPIGLGLAGRNPERFSRFVIGNTFAWAANGNFHFEVFSRLIGGPIGGFLIRNFNAFVNLVIPAGMKRKRPDHNLMQMYRGPFWTRTLREPTHIFAREILRSRQFLAQVRQGIENIAHKPVLILWGDRDVAFRDKERQVFEQVFQNYKTVILKGAGHFIQEDAPEQIVEEFRLWWQDNSP